MRAIVKNALRVDELTTQFEIDGMDSDIVDAYYPDTYIVNEARWRLEMAVANLQDLHYSEPDYKFYKRHEGQLKRFIAKWENKCEAHENDGLSKEKLKEKIEGSE